MGGLKAPGFVVLIVLAGAIIGLVVSCDQADEVFITAPSYQDQIDTSYWRWFDDELNSGPSVVIGAVLGIDGSHYGVPPGAGVESYVALRGIDRLITAFDLRIAFNSDALEVTHTAPGNLITNGEWEYFNIERSQCLEKTCFHLTGVTSIDGAMRNDVIIRSANPVAIITMSFDVSTDRGYDNQEVPIRFYWEDCSDNWIRTLTEEGLEETAIGVKWRVFDASGWYWLSDLIEFAGFPSIIGVPNYCCDLIDHDRPVNRVLWFIDGGVSIGESEPDPIHGDLNLDGYPYRSDDAALFADYFVQGMEAFTIWLEYQVQQSDVNYDGCFLTIEDLVYLWRRVNRTEKHFELLEKGHSAFTTIGDTLRIKNPIGGLYLEAPGDVTPTLLASQMEMRFTVRDDTTRILLYSPSSDSASGNLLYMPGGWSSMRAATPDGAEMLLYDPAATITLSATPNPFTDSTVFSFDWPFARDYCIHLYDFTGREIDGVTGEGDSVARTAVWRPGALPAGVYEARLYWQGRMAAATKLLKKN
ncbi:MAG TPA: hypothetical protein PLF13_12235 [candidate division Zixibacteria bacterium]|nr:hypothetical protein [candidate division Zixibacteria bacterium]